MLSVGSCVISVLIVITNVFYAQVWCMFDLIYFMQDFIKGRDLSDLSKIYFITAIIKPCFILGSGFLATTAVLHVAY